MNEDKKKPTGTEKLELELAQARADLEARDEESRALRDKAAAAERAQEASEDQRVAAESALSEALERISCLEEDLARESDARVQAESDREELRELLVDERSAHARTERARVAAQASADARGAAAAALGTTTVLSLLGHALRD